MNAPTLTPVDGLPASVTDNVHTGLPASVTDNVHTGCNRLDDLALAMEKIHLQNAQWQKETAQLNNLPKYPAWFREAHNGGICGQCGHRFDTGETVVIAYMTIRRPTARPGYLYPSCHRYTLCLPCTVSTSPFKVILRVK